MFGAVRDAEIHNLHLNNAKRHHGHCVGIHKTGIHHNKNAKKFNLTK